MVAQRRIGKGVYKDMLIKEGSIKAPRSKGVVVARASMRSIERVEDRIHQCAPLKK